MILSWAKIHTCFKDRLWYVCPASYWHSMYCVCIWFIQLLHEGLCPTACYCKRHIFYAHNLPETIRAYFITDSMLWDSALTWITWLSSQIYTSLNFPNRNMLLLYCWFPFMLCNSYSNAWIKVILWAILMWLCYF